MKSLCFPHWAGLIPLLLRLPLDWGPPDSPGRCHLKILNLVTSAKTLSPLSQVLGLRTWTQLSGATIWSTTAGDPVPCLPFRGCGWEIMRDPCPHWWSPECVLGKPLEQGLVGDKVLNQSPSLFTERREEPPAEKVQKTNQQDRRLLFSAGNLLKLYCGDGYPTLQIY